MAITQEAHLTPGNILYSVLFGWWLAILYFGAGGKLRLSSGRLLSLLPGLVRVSLRMCLPRMAGPAVELVVADV